MGSWLLLCIVIVFLLLGFILCGTYYPRQLTTEYYEILSPKLTKDYKIALLTDYHACCDGARNDKILQILHENQPDALFIAGDLVIKTGKRKEEALQFLHQLSEKYNIYYAPGNHERELEESGSEMCDFHFENVRYLANDAISSDGNIIVYGLDLPLDYYAKCWNKNVLTKEVVEECLGKNKEDAFSLLLAHNPEHFEAYAKWGADLTLSGHVHGGIMRLPFLGGVIAPSLRLFPKYDAGRFEKEGKTMIISRGVGQHTIKLRFFNVPEVSIINLTCQKEQESV